MHSVHCKGTPTQNKNFGWSANNVLEKGFPRYCSSGDSILRRNLFLIPNRHTDGRGGWRKHHPFKYHSYSFWIIWNSYSSWYDLDYLKAQMKNRFPMGSSVLITGKISTTPSQFWDLDILRVKSFIIGIYGKYESNTCEQTENSRKNKLAKPCKFRFLAPLWFYLKVLCI